jgi:broad specificity phosphatase PhoE
VEIVFVRHAETVWNAEGRWQGQTDVPLSDKGRAEVRAVTERLRGERFDRIVSSDLRRALDTASGIASALDAPPAIERDAALREMNLGRWCGLLHAEVESKFPGELALLQAGTFAEGTLRRIGIDGETLVELDGRVSAALDAVIAGAKASDRVLVVTHGGVIRAVLMSMLRLDGMKRPLVGARNTAITTLHVDEGARVLRTYNDARHTGPHPLDGHAEIAGPEGRAHVIELLGLANDVPLALPHERATTIVSREKRQLVAFGVPSR